MIRPRFHTQLLWQVAKTSNLEFRVLESNLLRGFEGWIKVQLEEQGNEIIGLRCSRCQVATASPVLVTQYPRAVAHWLMSSSNIELQDAHQHSAHAVGVL